MSAPELKTERAFVVDCRDLDKFVNMHLEGFGKTWRALDTGYDGYHNGSYAKVEVSAGTDVEIEDDLDQDFNRWLMDEGPFYLDDEDGKYSYDLPGIENMLRWLHSIDAIVDGTYVVELWW